MGFRIESEYVVSFNKLGYRGMMRCSRSTPALPILPSKGKSASAILILRNKNRVVRATDCMIHNIELKSPHELWGKRKSI